MLRASQQNQVRNFESHRWKSIEDKGRPIIHVPGVCFDIADCDYKKGNPAADSLILYAECCDNVKGKSLALSNGSCADCYKRGAVTTPAPATNDTHYIKEWTPWRRCSQECGPGTRSRQKICGRAGNLKVCEVQDEDCNLGSSPGTTVHKTYGL